MKLRNVKLVFFREVRDQLRDRRTLFMITVLPVLLYPAIGIGMLEMKLSLREQPRRVVILGTDELPERPALIDETGIRSRWFSGGVAATEGLEVILDQARDASDSDANQVDAGAAAVLLQDARQMKRLAAQLQALGGLEDQDLSPRAAAVRRELNELFRRSDIDLLVIFPEGFAEGLRRANEQIESHGSEPALPLEYAGPLLLRNSADDKSALAFQRVDDALRAWERGILQDRLTRADLPEDLHEPVRLEHIDLAETEQISANVWSKVFTALLVVMTVTGAFYPAIDLGAGEKERGTMETLLICPAYRSEIVIGKFLTVMLFSISTALLNLATMGMTGQYMATVGGVAGALGEMTFPPFSVLAWVLVLMIPLAALFSALCLGLATFARSSKEGQYYLTPLLMATLGITIFCLFPAVEITPFYSVLPVVNVALLLKGMLLAPVTAQSLYGYIVPVMVSSAGYSVLALWWAIELFNSENVLFREAERVSPRLWLRHLLRDKGTTPNFTEAALCFAVIMFLQFGMAGFMQQGLAGGDPASAMLRALLIQQVAIIACPALLMAVLLTRSFRQTLRLHMPSLPALGAAAALAVVLHPLSFELSASLQGWFFPDLPSGVAESMQVMSGASIWSLLLALAVAPAICEEIAFRGFILTGFQRSGRVAVPIVMSSLAFGTMHLLPQQVFNASLMGLVLGLIAVRSRSLLPCILFHLVYNSLGVFHGHVGAQLRTDGVFRLLFRHGPGDTLRYQPLLLAAAAFLAWRLLRWFLAMRSDQPGKPAPEPILMQPARVTD